jgi:hypothetical protein
MFEPLEPAPSTDAKNLYWLAQQLSKRYPGVRIVWAYNTVCIDGTTQQTVRYQAPRETFIHHNLLTFEMAALWAAGRRVTAMGELFAIHPRGFDYASRPGYVDLFVYTGAIPRSVVKMKLRPVKRELNRIFKSALEKLQT